MDRNELVGRVLDEGLLVEDALDIDLGMAKGVALNVGLVPAKAETSKGAAIQWRVLNQEHIEAGILRQPASSQDHDIVLRTSDKPVADGDARMRVLDGWAGEGMAGRQTWVHVQLERADRSRAHTLGIG